MNLLLQTFQLFHDRDPYHIETGLLICRANQWPGFYIIGTSVMEELKEVFLKPPSSIFLEKFPNTRNEI